MNKRKAATSTSLLQGKHIERLLISGIVGCGKSTYTMSKVKQHKRVVIYDSTSDYHEKLGYKMFHSLKDLGAAIKANYPKGFKYCYNPDSDDLNDDDIDEVKCLDELVKMLLTIQIGFKQGVSNTKILFVLEEASSVLPPETNINKNAKWFRKFLKKGRHFGIDFYCVDQSITEIHKMIAKGLTEYTVFKQPDIHYTYLSSLLGSKAMAKTATEQPEFNYIYKKGTVFHLGKTKK